MIIQNPNLRGLLACTNIIGNDWYVFVFTATEFIGKLIDSPEGQQEWIDDDKLTNLNPWDSDSIFLPWIEKGEFFSALFTQVEQWGV